MGDGDQQYLSVCISLADRRFGSGGCGVVKLNGGRGRALTLEVWTGHCREQNHDDALTVAYTDLTAEIKKCHLKTETTDCLREELSHSYITCKVL